VARRVAYLVFLIPVVISVPIAAYVLADIVSQPDRKLNLWPFDGSDDGHANSAVDPGAAAAYSVNGPTQAKAETLDSDFGCGDACIAAYDSGGVPATQNALFDPCSARNGYAPAGDRFPGLPDGSGGCQTVLVMLDGQQTAGKAAAADLR